MGPQSSLLEQKKALSSLTGQANKGPSYYRLLLAYKGSPQVNSGSTHGRQGAILGQHEAFPDRRNDLLGPLRPVQGPRRSTRGPLRAVWALPHQEIASSGESVSRDSRLKKAMEALLSQKRTSS